jgi:hypothetical protein
MSELASYLTFGLYFTSFSLCIFTVHSFHGKQPRILYIQIQMLHVASSLSIPTAASLSWKCTLAWLGLAWLVLAPFVSAAIQRRLWRTLFANFSSRLPLSIFLNIPAPHPSTHRFLPPPIPSPHQSLPPFNSIFVPRAQICKRLRRPGIDSKESISRNWFLAWRDRARICKRGAHK